MPVSRILKRLPKPPLFEAFLKRFDFVKLMGKVARREPGRSYAQIEMPTRSGFENQEEIARLAISLAERALAEKGELVSRQELESQAALISCQYDAKLYAMLRGATYNVITQFFQSDSLEHLFISKDQRELKHLDRLKQARAEGRGVVYLINHSSHWDEFIFNVFLDSLGLGLPLFAAGRNMMITPSLTRIFMTGSYVILRSGASRAYLSTLFSYCQALGELGKEQGIFLEAWSGGARTRDGSLRYPRRLITLQGALAARNDVFVQPVVISYSRVPEDLGLSDGAGLWSWTHGHHMYREVLKKPWQPVEGLIRGVKNLYGRTYVGFGQGRPLSELKFMAEEEHNSDLTLDEFVALYAIKEIARDKKIMATQLAARALGRARNKEALPEAAATALEEIRSYHRHTFGQEPDLEDFIREHSLSDALRDGLQSLTRRRIIGRSRPFSSRPARVLSAHGLAYYATHADRRLYSPSAKENFVVCGAGIWGYALVSYLGRRTLNDKKYNNSSLTLYDADNELIGNLANERTLGEPFPDHRLPKNVFTTNDHTAAFRKATEVVVAAPPQEVPTLLDTIFQYALELRTLIIASRGFDPQSHRLTMQMAWEAAVSHSRSKTNILALSGPFTPEDLLGEEGGLWILAGQVSRGRASEALLFKYGAFRVQISADPIGVQMAASLADAYTLYAGALNRQKNFRRSPSLTAAFAREISAEAKSLALALGGQPQTFEADNPAWVSECLIKVMNDAGTAPSRLLWSEGESSMETATILRQELAAHWPDTAAAGYFSIHSAYLTAKHLGLNLPHLEEANRLFWG